MFLLPLTFGMAFGNKHIFLNRESGKQPDIGVILSDKVFGGLAYLHKHTRQIRKYILVCIFWHPCQCLGGKNWPCLLLAAEYFWLIRSKRGGASYLHPKSNQVCLYSNYYLYLRVLAERRLEWLSSDKEEMMRVTDRKLL